MQRHNHHNDCCGPSGKAAELPHQHEAVTIKGGGHSHDAAGPKGWLGHWPLLTALLAVLVMMVLEYGFKIRFTDFVQLCIFIPAYLLSGYHVLELAFRKAFRLDFFNEFFLMSLATLGAFAIGSYSEGVAVMVFYSIGEWFQDVAVNNAKRSIKSLLDIRPDRVDVIRSGQVITVEPADVQTGEVIQIKPGERVALDGNLLSERAIFNTAALTGESMPDEKVKDDKVLAGMISLNQLTEIRVTALFRDSKLSRILEMVQDAAARKSRTQLFISRFAKIYTPLVFLLAVMVVMLPYLFVADYVFREWLYRGLVFLVISCPCALVVSIPLGYFGGIGLASRNGILFKGANFLDVITTVDMVVMDKTGTLTKGIFEVQQVVSANDRTEKELVRLVAALESKSTHPVAVAVRKYAGDGIVGVLVEKVEELAGLGLSGLVDGKEILAGNAKLLDKFNVACDEHIRAITDTVVVVAVNQVYAGYIRIADELKDDALLAIEELHALNIRTVMLSGDKESVVKKVAAALGIDAAFGDLLPEHKVQKVQELKDKGLKIAFAGDGVNDAPVVALADAGIAMGGLGSDATIETADVVVQNDQPSKIAMAVRIGRITRNVVWQNIALAMAVKLAVLALGAGGVATLWEAVIADVGVALLAILNAVRIQKMKLR